MQKIEIAEGNLTEGARLQTKNDGSVFTFSKEGAGFFIPELIGGEERYLTFWAQVMEEHSVAMELRIYTHDGEKPDLTVRFGLLPQVRAMVCLDMKWLEAEELFPESMPGTLKIVCHGKRVHREDISKAVLFSMASFHDVKIKIEDMALTDQHPEKTVLSGVKLVDCFGQYKCREWNAKVKSQEELKERLERLTTEKDTPYPFEDWSAYGGWKKKKLTDPTGYFSRCKAEGRWWLTDPQGYAFFSFGPDCVGPGVDCRIDDVEEWLDWLPDRQEEAYKEMFHEARGRSCRRRPQTFSFLKANLYRGLGEHWYEAWRDMIGGQLRKYGMNTLGNWSDERLLGTIGIPYVTSLPEFPSTSQNIFRDFPDVFSDEYKEQAKRCAKALEPKKSDSLMIGYFLRNEPAWAFVDHLVLGDEVLYNPANTACKERLLSFLKERYGNIGELNRSWACRLDSFEDLRRSQREVSRWSKTAERDMKEFSRLMLKAYVEIPVAECRKTDPNHMILGMRWAWISDPDIVTGWENFDVFSINCYATDPTEAIQNVVAQGVDLPVLLGEFHFGALDAGLPATGLEGVASQKDRGIACRYYAESVAAHPNGVGCHYFQCYDQFVLGRFDGENYNIGLFDICSMPYREVLEQIREAGRSIYEVAAGQRERIGQRAESIPMIAY